jgi:hypothetical protein
VRFEAEVVRELTSRVTTPDFALTRVTGSIIAHRDDVFEVESLTKYKFAAACSWNGGSGRRVGVEGRR